MAGIWPSALLLHPDCGRHDTGWRHPEHQGRLPAIVQELARETPDLLERVLQRQGEAAPLAALERVHEPRYLERLRGLAEEAERRGEVIPIDADTVVSGASWDAALAAAGCLLAAVGLVVAGEAESALALTRPPGHHALPNRAMGFCLLNHAAIAVRELQRRHGLERVLVVDWDVHHGNGTQDVFYADPDVYFISLHQSPHYPGTGAASERGEGAGAGRTLNIPLAAGTTRAAYRAAFTAALDRALEDFSPDFVLVSAGFDCLAGDPLGGLLLEPEDLHALTVVLRERTRGSPARGRLAVTLEGGYQPARTARGVTAVLRALAGLPPR